MFCCLKMQELQEQRDEAVQRADAAEVQIATYVMILGQRVGPLRGRSVV